MKKIILSMFVTILLTVLIPVKDLKRCTCLKDPDHCPIHIVTVNDGGEGWE